MFLGYVEDDKTGTSFALLREIKWKIYIEVSLKIVKIIKDIAIQHILGTSFKTA